MKKAKRKPPRRARRASGQRELALGVAPERTGPTMAEKVAYYRRHWLEGKAPTTQANQNSSLKMMVADLPPYPSLSDVMNFIVRRRTDPVRPWASSTIRNCLFIGSKVCVFARNEWETYVCPDPFGAADKPTKAREAPRCIPEPEVTFPALLEACKDDLERAFICLMRYQGLRESEALGLFRKHEWDGERVACDVELTASPPLIHIRRQRKAGRAAPKRLKTPASHATRHLHPMVARYLRRALLQAVADQDQPGRGRPRGGAARTRFLFPYSGLYLYGRGPDDMRALYNRLRAVAPEAFPRKVPGEKGGSMAHPFRHTFGEDMAKKWHADKAMAFMRHAHISSTATYFGAIRGRLADEKAMAELTKEVEEAEKKAAEATKAKRRGGNLRVLTKGSRQEVI